MKRVAIALMLASSSDGSIFIWDSIHASIEDEASVPMAVMSCKLARVGPKVPCMRKRDSVASSERSAPAKSWIL